MSNSRGTLLYGDGSGGLTGYGSRGSRKALQPPLATTRTATVHTRRPAAKRLVVDMAVLSSRRGFTRAVFRDTLPDRQSRTRSRNNRHSLSNRKSLPLTLLLPGKTSLDAVLAFTGFVRMGRMRRIQSSWPQASPPS